MAGYIRQDVSNTIENGFVVDADMLDNEFNALQAAFNASTGHTHDGTAAGGAPIIRIGPVQDVVVSSTAIFPKTTNTVDVGSNVLRYKHGFFEGAVTATEGFTGNATTATTLKFGRNFSITGGATAAAVSFDGSANVTLSVTALDATTLTGAINKDRIPTEINRIWTKAAQSEAITISPVTGTLSQSISWADSSGTSLMQVGRRNVGTGNFAVTAGGAVGTDALGLFKVDLATGDIAWTGAASGNISNNSTTQNSVAPIMKSIYEARDTKVGCIAFMKNNSLVTLTPGDVAAATDLRYSSSIGNNGAAPNSSSQWTCLGTVAPGNATLFYCSSV